MNIKFQIKPTSAKAETEGKEIIRFSGEAEAYIRKATRISDLVGKDPAGNPIVKFRTGIDPSQVDFYYWFSDEEKEVVKTQINEYLPLLEKRFRGKQVLSDENSSFWKDERDRYHISLTITTKTQFFTTENLDHALLYFGIIGGAFMDMIAPNKDFAERMRIPHYLSLETDVDDEEFEDVSESLKAGANLFKLSEEGSPDGLFILCWTALYNTKGFGSLIKSTPKKDLVTYLKMFIDGELVDKKKKSCAKTFNSFVSKWEGSQTRPLLYVEAYIKAGEQFALIVTKERKYETSWGLPLGNTLEEAVTKISQKKYAEDLKRLQDEIEKKWNM